MSTSGKGNPAYEKLCQDMEAKYGHMIVRAPHGHPRNPPDFLDDYPEEPKESAE